MKEPQLEFSFRHEAVPQALRGAAKQRSFKRGAAKQRSLQ
jgi:hypothetical protein